MRGGFRFGCREPKAVLIDINVELLDGFSNGKRAVSSNDFTDVYSVCSQIDCGCSRPWEERTGVDDSGLFDGMNGWFVSVTDD